MASLGLVLRALWWRRGITAAILAVATAVTTAATAGPVYLRAASESVLQDALRGAPTVETGLDFHNQTPAQPDPVVTLAREARTAISHSRSPAYGKPILALEYGGDILDRSNKASTVSLVTWRDGACAQVRILVGRCPTAAGEGLVSARYAATQRLRVGDPLRVVGLTSAAGTKPMTIVGLYRPVDPNGNFWFGRSYFPVPSDATPEPVDAVFTPRSTFAGLVQTVPVTAVVDVPLVPSKVNVANVGLVRSAIDDIHSQLQAVDPAAGADTAITGPLDEAAANQDGLATPVALIIAQLLVLCWLVLFIVVGNAAEARGGEIALAKLRGLRTGSTVAFGLVEPLVVLVLAVPLGIALGVLAVVGIAHAQLAPGIPVVLTSYGVLAALAATAGGAIATALGVRATLRRPVLEQWRRAVRRSPRREAALEAGVAVAAVAALAQLYLSGRLHGSHTNVLALLAPGLVSLALALLGARALGLLACSTYGPTRARRRLGVFLAVRQIGRRPANARVVVILVTAFGLATFSLVSWSVARENRTARAKVEVGADRVLTVATPLVGSLQTPLESIVRRLDPSGNAMAVADFTSFNGGDAGRHILGVDSSRLAKVAYWRPDFLPMSPARAAALLHPPVPNSVLLGGDALAVDLSVDHLVAAGPVLVQADVVTVDGEVAVPLGALPSSGPARLSGTLTGCAAARSCRLADLTLTRPLGQLYSITVTVDFTGLESHSAGGWSPVGAGFNTRGRWTSLNNGQYSPPDTVDPTATGLHYAAAAPDTADTGIGVLDSPIPLPALATASVYSGADAAGKVTATTGLVGDPIDVRVVARADTLPRGADNGLVVDLDYALRQAVGGYRPYTEEVWLSPAAPADFAARLQRAGVAVLSTERPADRIKVLARQGPALALLLFLIGAGLAAALAAGGAVLNLYLLGRRRTFELAAMSAVGVRRGALLTSLLVEQGLLLGFGVLLGVAAGLLASSLALPSVPEFTDNPTSPALLYSPNPAVVAGLVAALTLAIAIVVTLAAVRLVRAAEPEQLREAQA